MNPNPAFNDDLGSDANSSQQRRGPLKNKRSQITAKPSKPGSSFQRNARSPSITDIDELANSGFKISNAQLRMSNASSTSKKSQQAHDKKTDVTIQKFQKIAQKINSMKFLDIKDVL